MRFGASGARTVLSTSGSQAVSRAIDPITGQGACATTPAADEAGTAAYRLPAATGKGYTLLGSPVLSARFAVTGREPALAARLWDVAPGGATQTLVARALYRPRPGKPPGLPAATRTAGTSPPATCRSSSSVGRDSPYGRPSNFDWSIVRCAGLPVQTSAAAR